MAEATSFRARLASPLRRLVLRMAGPAIQEQAAVAREALARAEALEHAVAALTAEHGALVARVQAAAAQAERVAGKVTDQQALAAHVARLEDVLRGAGK